MDPLRCTCGAVWWRHNRDSQLDASQVAQALGFGYDPPSVPWANRTTVTCVECGQDARNVVSPPA